MNGVEQALDSGKQARHKEIMTNRQSGIDAQDGEHGARPLAGQRAWIISDGKAGHEIQMLGVAEALGCLVEVKRIAEPGRLYKLTAPHGAPPRGARFGVEGSTFGPPWPRIAFATGRLTTPYIRALKRMAGLQTFTVILLDPKTRANAADLYWVPEHDRRRGANVVTTLVSPHRYGPARLEDLRRRMPEAIARLPGPRIAVLVGGPNGDYRFTSECIERFTTHLSTVAQSGAGLMITTSRRTPPDLLAALERATASGARILYTGEGENPYPDFLAHADAFIVTADSVNMAGEAAATGKPVYIFHPEGGSPKFDRFHARLRNGGITRPLYDARAPLETWHYQPLDAARTIADEIERRYLKRVAMIPGLCQPAADVVR